MSNGLVSLVGAGPGDPELLTIKGKRRIEEADIVMFDRLIDPSILSYAQSDTKLINVGKMPHHHRVKQSEINQMLVDFSLEGKRVVRLKAGDPYVLGRGGEEAQFLTLNGIPFEVVPGLTSAIAGLASAGIPVTHRDFASSFHVISAHLKSQNGLLDWNNIAQQEGTLVFLMGMENLELIVEQLKKYGKSGNTPVGIIQWASQWRQRDLIGKLDNIVQLVADSKIGSPSLIVVGDVVSLHAQIDYVLPLFGQRILVADNSSNSLVNSLRDQGASIVTYRRGQNVKANFNIVEVLDNSQVLFEDFYSFEFFLNELNDKNRDIRSLSEVKLLASTQRLAKMMKNTGVIADGIIDIETATDIKDTAILGGSASQYVAESNFFKTYQRNSSTNDNIDFESFSKLLFISQISVTDLLDSIIEEKIPEIKKIPALAMGEKVQKLLLKKGFAQVNLVKPKNKEVVKYLLGEKY